MVLVCLTINNSEMRLSGMTENLSVLGSTGSIGVQTLNVAEKLNIPVSALTANKNVELMERQVRKFKPELAVMYDEHAAKELKIKLKDTSTRVYSGVEGLCEAAGAEKADTVLNAVVGMVGLQPTLAAIQAGKSIALANKETLVAGGDLVMRLVKEKGIKLYPVDSEHSAIFQCLQGCADKKEVKKIILTASGGPFFGKQKKDLRNITVEQALKHPNWNMGAKITIDSATMMNKGLEIIEACWLFDLPQSKVDVVVHRESIIHSMVEYKDNSVIAQLGTPDMQIPIQYAITYPNRVESLAQPLDLTEISKLTFFKPDYDTFVCLQACVNAINRGGAVPAAANGANEEAVKLFLEEKIAFLQIGELVQAAAENQKATPINCLEDVLAADKNARRFVKNKVMFN